MIGCNSKPATDQAEVKPPRVTDTIEPDQTSGTSDSTTRLKPEQVAETAPESFQVDRVQNLIQAGDFEAAGKVLHQHLVANPNDPVALFTLAQLHAASDDLETAIKTLRHPAIEESDAALPALGTTADWLVQLGRSEEAADCYRRMLQVAPDAVMIHRRLASLMIRTGRPPLAQASLRQLCRSGNIQRPELAALISISQADSDRPIGPVAEARRLAKQHDYQGAVDQLAARSETEYQTPDVSAFQTRMLAETQQDKMVAKRLVQGRVEQKAYSDYWAALGIHSLRRKDVETAITAFSNAIAIDPTDASSLQRLSQAYRTWGDVESADRLHK
ncbi:tetratricopeptide repeat protein, partial [Rhodopirellula bahusiensis]